MWIIFTIVLNYLSKQLLLLKIYSTGTLHANKKDNPINFEKKQNIDIKRVLKSQFYIPNALSRTTHFAVSTSVHMRIIFDFLLYLSFIK